MNTQSVTNLRQLRSAIAMAAFCALLSACGADPDAGVGVEAVDQMAATAASASSTSDGDQSSAPRFTVTLVWAYGDPIIRDPDEARADFESLLVDVGERRSVSVEGGRVIVSVWAADDDAEALVREAFGDDRYVYLRPVQGCTDEGTALPTVSTSTEQRSRPDPAVGQLLPLLGGGQCAVGPAEAFGTVFRPDAEASIIAGGWGVLVSLSEGSSGVDAWNAVAAKCYEQTDDCPSGRLALDVDGVIVTAPSVNVPEFTGSVQITGDFTEAEATQLARALRWGAVGGYKIEQLTSGSDG